MTRLFAPRGALLLGILALASCSHASQVGSPDSMRAGADGWRSLPLTAFRGYKDQEIPKGWSVVDGNTIQKTGEAEDLVSREQFGNFELTLDWKLAPGGNSGLFYRATEEYEHIYWSGPEYQLLDNARHPDGKNPLTQAGSAYGLYAPPAGAAHEAGEWNSTRIVARGNHIEHWLNGAKVADYEIGSPDWTAKVAKSKFGAWPNYGKAARGYIGIQGDHTGLLAIRDIKIKVLP